MNSIEIFFFSILNKYTNDIQRINPSTFELTYYVVIRNKIALK